MIVKYQIPNKSVIMKFFNFFFNKNNLHEYVLNNQTMEYIYAPQRWGLIFIFI